MFAAHDLACQRGGRSLFAQVNLSMRPGDYCELRGPNGSGKTSLLRIFAGLLPPSQGHVGWMGVPIQGQREDFLGSLVYIGHRPAVKHDLTAAENLRVACGLGGRPIGQEDARTALARFGLSGCEHLRARQLSEGQQRRLALSRLLIRPASLWLLDEALTALDANALKTLTAIVVEHLARGGMAIVATHQPLDLPAAPQHRIDLAA